MMEASMEMSTPVTRGELRQELAELEQKFEQRLARMATKEDLAGLATKAEIAELATKAELAELAARLDQFQDETRAAFARTPTKVDLENWGLALLNEIGRHTRAIQESMAAQISVIDEKYNDLPRRVGRLEETVFGPGGRGEDDRGRTASGARPAEVRTGPRRRRRAAR